MKNLINKTTPLLILGIILILTSHYALAIDPVHEYKTTTVQPQNNPIAEKYITHLKAGKDLSSFFIDNWTFIYHEDNRCDGSTDGQIENLKATKIDGDITLEVTNDGAGWACNKKAPSTFEMTFALRKKIATWDRIEVLKNQNLENGIIYVVGAGESDYLKLHLNTQNRIVKLEYRSEDPG